MYFVLMIAGLLGVVVGLITIALGLPERSFSVGAVLMTCGTMATIGGVILVALASILRQLRRMTDMLESRPVPPTAVANEAEREALEPQLTPVSASVSAPVGASAAAQRSELSLSPLQVDARSASMELDRGARNTAPEIRSPGLDAVEAVLAPDLVANREAALAGDATPVPANVTLAQSAHGQSNTDRKSEPRVEASAGGEGRKREPMFRAGARARAELGLPDKADNGNARAPEVEERPAVLKSGVIEGMAYTLYADGSIDAELTEGTVKFNSIPDLRNYLGHRTG